MAAGATVVSTLPVFTVGAMAVQLTRDLDFGAVGVGAAVGAFFATMALTAVPLGRVVDRIGATWSLRLSATGAIVVGAGVVAVARSWATFVVWLILAGAANSLAEPASNRLLVSRIEPSRLGAAFGVKQSAPPLGSMLAGFGVPLIAVTVGWRWAYALVIVLAILLLIAIGRRPSSPGPRARQANVREPLRDPGTIVALAIGFGMSFGASSVVLGFYVDSAVSAGTSPSLAGVLFAFASLAAIIARLISGFASDRFRVDALVLSAVLVAGGAVGLVLLALGRPVVMAVGAILALAGTWGFPSVFFLALMRAYPETPGRITGAMSPGLLGGVIAPVVFGVIADRLGYAAAWSFGAVLAMFGAAVILGVGRFMTRKKATA